MPELEWFNKNSENLFNTRQILEDEYSKLQFDLYVLLKVVGYNKFFFPRTYFDDFITIESKDEFTSELPKEFSGFPLSNYKVSINNSSAEKLVVNLVATEPVMT